MAREHPPVEMCQIEPHYFRPTLPFRVVWACFLRSKEIAATGTDASSHYLNEIASLGVQPMILHSFSKASMVMFRFFLRESSE